MVKERLFYFPLFLHILFVRFQGKMRYITIMSTEYSSPGQEMYQLIIATQQRPQN